MDVVEVAPPYDHAEITAILAHLWRNVGETELLVDALLSGARDAAASCKEAIFIELPAVVVGEATQRDVVRLGTGEVEKRSAIACLGHGTDVDLQPGAQSYRCAAWAVGKDVRDVLVADEFVADGQRCVEGIVADHVAGQAGRPGQAVGVRLFAGLSAAASARGSAAASDGAPLTGRILAELVVNGRADLPGGLAAAAPFALRPPAPLDGAVAPA